MALIVNDRVRESTTVVGTGTATLLGAITGYQAFSVIGNGNTCYYTISDQIGANWEVGIGTYTLSGTTLARTTVLKSSNANALVSFTAGTKDVFVTYPAGTSVSGGGGGTYPTTQPSLNLDFANTKQLDPRITFVRNSTATYYDGQTTALAEQNLLQYSQTFANAYWAKQYALATDNATTAPDGTTTATTIVEGVGLSVHGVTFQNVLSISIGTYTASAYFKYNTRQWVALSLWDGTTYNGVLIDLVGGTIVSTLGTIISSTITSVGSGWYRVSITKSFSSAISTACGTFLSDSATPTLIVNRPQYTGDGTSGIYIWGEQLEQRSSVTAYTPTTTAAITNYIPVLMTAPAGVARFDCDPITGKSLGLLIEESRTNLLTYSSDFSNAAWVKDGTTIDSDTVIAPDGTLVGDKLIESTSTGLHRIYRTISGITAIPYTFSVYAKYSGKQWIALQISGSTYFDLLNGVVGTSTSGSTGTITPVGNGWYRCSTTRTLSAGSTSGEVYLGNSNGGASYTGDGYSGAYIWGAQLEAGSFATSYIPTVASTVTRAADSASMTGTNFSSWYNQAQGTVYVDSDTFASGTSAKGVLEFSNTTVNNQTIRISYLNGGNASYCTATLPTDVGTFRPQAPPNKPYKITLSYSSGNIATFSINGINTVASSGSAGAITAPIDVLAIGKLYYSGALLCGHIRKLSYYPVALSSSSLVALTS